MTTFDLTKLHREIDEDGTGHPPSWARKHAGLPEPTVVFLRDDGWSVGAGTPAAEREAYLSWRGFWTHFARGPEWELRPIGEYDRQECEYCGRIGHDGGCSAQERHDRRCL